MKIYFILSIYHISLMGGSISLSSRVNLAIKSGRNVDLATLIESYGAAEVVAAHSDMGETPLYQAAREGNANACRLLVDAGAAVDADDLLIALSGIPLFARYAECIQVMIATQTGAQHARHPITGPAMLMQIAQPEVARMVIAAGATVNPVRTNPAAHTPLSSAISKGHIGVCNVLLEYGAAVNVWVDGRTPLHMAAKFGHLDLFGRLVAAGANVNAQLGDGPTPLHLACVSPLHQYDTPAMYRRRILQLVHTVLAAGADVNIRGQATLHLTAGQTALHLAAGCDEAELCLMLLDAGADKNVANADGVLHAQCAGNRSTQLLIEQYTRAAPANEGEQFAHIKNAANTS